jgi:hypothetical protein
MCLDQRIEQEARHFLDPEGLSHFLNDVIAWIMSRLMGEIQRGENWEVIARALPILFPKDILRIREPPVPPQAARRRGIPAVPLDAAGRVLRAKGRVARSAGYHSCRYNHDVSVKVQDSATYRRERRASSRFAPTRDPNCFSFRLVL